MLVAYTDTTRSHATMDCDVNAMWAFAMDTIVHSADSESRSCELVAF